MKEQRPRIFISHSSRDESLAGLLVDDLRKLDIDIWYDEFEILVGHDITDKVYDGIMSSDYLAVILTKNSVQSRWVREELNLAKLKSITAGGKRTILPLLFEECSLPASIATLKFADFRGSYAKGFEELARAVGVTLIKAKVNPIGSSFWQRVMLMFDDPISGQQIDFQEATKKATDSVRHHETSFWYTLKDMNLTPSQAESYESAKSTATWGYYESNCMHTLIADFALLKIARALGNSLDHFKDPRLSQEETAKIALEDFKTSLLRDLYSTYNGLKHEAEILASIKECITILVSVTS